MFALLLTAVPLGQDLSGKTVPVQSGISFERPDFQLDRPSFRPWEGEGAIQDSRMASRRRTPVPAATVEVVDSAAMDRQQRFLDFRARTAPLLRLAFEAGSDLRFNKQMLRELMAADPSHPHPPSVPSVFYNNFKPPEENPAIKEMKQRK